MGKIAAALEKSRRPVESSRAPQPLQAPKVKSAEESNRQAPRTKDQAVLPNNTDPDLITLSQSHDHNFASEQFKLLKTHLLFSNEGPPPRLIMITSALPGEGKSFVAANLAVSIAQNVNEHVLLIDCDLRRPRIHKIFGMGDTPGLSEYLKNGHDISEFLVKTLQEKLTLLPAGGVPANPLELIASQKMTDLLGEIKHRYNDRYVVIDSPPPHLTAESNALARIVDTVLLVIRQGSADRSIISELIGNLGKEKIGGVVFNRFDMTNIGAMGYGKYGKYGQYKRYYK